MGTRVYTEPVEGAHWPTAKNVKTRQGRFGRGHPEFGRRTADIYAVLCEAVHPNVEAQGVLWRSAPPLQDGRQRLAFEPSASQSPVKTAIVDAVIRAYGVLLPYCRDLWWIAAETACARRFRRTEETVSLGVPLPGGSRVSCCCGSGLLMADCDHPEPPLPSNEIISPGEPPS